MIVGLGVDVVDLARFTRAMERTPALASRLFTEAELQGPSGARSLRSLGARFAAKEAAMKALGAHLVSQWHELEVVQDDEGAPSLRLSGNAAHVAADRGIARLLVSLSHDGPVALATVIAESNRD